MRKFGPVCRRGFVCRLRLLRVHLVPYKSICAASPAGGHSLLCSAYGVVTGRNPQQEAIERRPEERFARSSALATAEGDPQ
jgi:hypothetical protein